ILASASAASDGLRKALPRRAAAHDLPFLNALAFEDLGGEHVAVRINRNVVHTEELARHPAEASVAGDHFAVAAAHHTHLVIAAIDHDQETLVPVRPQIEVPDRTAEGLRQIDMLANEAAVLVEDLHAVVRAIADVDQAIV